jgi:hypothetical protein
VVDTRPLPRSALPESKKRYVPTLVGALGIPFLRFKKPQSRYLSRVIRDKIEQRQKRYDNLTQLDADIGWAMDEDVWDRTVEAQARNEGIRGLSSTKVDKVESKWQTVFRDSQKQMNDLLATARRREWVFTQAMWGIVKEERELKIKEEGIKAYEKEIAGRRRRRPRAVS